MNFLNDLTKLSYVEGKSVLNWFKSKFQEISHISGTYHCNVKKDFRIMLGDFFMKFLGFTSDSMIVWEFRYIQHEFQKI